MNKTKQIAIMGMLCAAAYIMLALRFPLVSVEFLKYDPKDIVIVIGGFILGPLSAFYISLVVSVIEMFTLSTTGVIGLFMNVISSCGFACTAAAIYKKKRTVAGAVIGLAAGVAVMTVLMLFWNYLITPLYTHMPPAEIAKMLMPVFLPFNLIKGTLNMAFTLMLYKPIITALRRAGLIERPAANSGSKMKVSIGIYVIGIFLLVTGILAALVLRGAI